MSWLVVTIGLLAALAVLAAGFLVTPRPLAPPPETAPPHGTLPPHDGWPQPVRRHYAASTGRSSGPVMTFALWGRARMRIRGVPLRATFWSGHRIGVSARQDITVTWYGLPVLRGVDTFSGGHGRMVIAGRAVTGPEIDQGENLFVWAELVLLPSAIVRRGAVWLPDGEHSAILVVPYAGGTDTLRFRFDPVTGLLSEGFALRYREPGGEKIGWKLEYRDWRHYGGMLFPSRLTVTWADQARPWFELAVDGVAVNPALTAM
ncbi:DUF6544 family protein [Longispora albida]|uniref:DUF6544 family protein n=1 Tax=Longispora albida TaxID=203523 RepID=UPI00036BE08D|nr:DUF6544 family protein [Longispora albida]